MDNQVTALALPDEATSKRDIEAINNFQRIVRSCMVEGQDYGVIPGTDKPSLLKPGAEKITKLLGLADRYELTEVVENWDKPFFHYVLKCTLILIATGAIVSEGFGSCNSMESKYRWREAKRKCPLCGADAIIKGKAEYGGGWICFNKKGGCGFKWPDGTEVIEKQVTGMIENDDIYSIVNTLMKMAEKRALVDAALHAGRLSQVFTQDIEDYPETSKPTEAKVVDSKMRQPAAPPKPKPAPLQKDTNSEEDWDKMKREETPESPGTDLATLELANPGEFYTACLKHFKLVKSQVDKEIAIYDLSNASQREQAWQTIVGIYGVKKDE